MGLIYHDARQLLRAKAGGHHFGAVVTIGRQSFYLTASESKALCAEFALPQDGWTRTAFGTPADAFFTEALEATSVAAIDVSDYEGAGIIHDMNAPIDEHLSQRFDSVIDGGSLEHIFNVPVALANLMRLARVGGIVFISTPCNNLSGHGFYQFSPELMYRVFTPDRGFDAREVSLAEYRSLYVEKQPPIASWRVVDPAVVGRRVELMSARAAMLWVQAQKREHTDEPFAVMPQQSDYVVCWQAEDQAETPQRPRRRRDLLRSVVPARLRAAYSRRQDRRRVSTDNRSFFLPL